MSRAACVLARARILPGSAQFTTVLRAHLPSWSPTGALGINDARRCATNRFSTTISSLLNNPNFNRRTTTYQPPPRVTLKDLGAGRTVRIVVVVCICIPGTLETVFWAKMLWRYFKGDDNQDDAEQVRNRD